MKQKGISQYALINRYNISPGQLTRLRNNQSVSTHTISVFCEILDCNVEDIMVFVPKDKNDALSGLDAPGTVSEGNDQISPIAAENPDIRYDPK